MSSAQLPGFEQPAITGRWALRLSNGHLGNSELVFCLFGVSMSRSAPRVLNFHLPLFNSRSFCVAEVGQQMDVVQW